MKESFRIDRVSWAFLKRWVQKGKMLWIWIAVAVIIVVAMYFFPASYVSPEQYKDAPPDLTDRVRWMGMLFQFLGVGTIVVGLREHLRLFGEDSMVVAFIRWLGEIRFVFVRKPPISASAHMRGVASVAAAGTIVPSVSGTVEERLTRLQNLVVEIQHDVNKLAAETKRIEKEIQEEVKKEAEERDRADRAIEKELRTTAIGGVQLELAGVAYLLVGILFSSIPSGVAFFLHKIVV